MTTKGACGHAPFGGSPECDLPHGHTGPHSWAGTPKGAYVLHQGRVRMILDGEREGDWIAFCLGCDWQADPLPNRPAFDEAAKHEREENLRVA